MMSASAASPSLAMCAIRGHELWLKPKRWPDCWPAPTCCRSRTFRSRSLRRPIRRHGTGNGPDRSPGGPRPRTDPMLSADDILIVLGSSDVSFLTSTPVLKLLRIGGKAGSAGDRMRRPVGAGRGIAADRQGILAGSPLARAASDLLPVACPARASSTIIRICWRSR